LIHEVPPLLFARSKPDYTEAASKPGSGMKTLVTVAVFEAHLAAKHAEKESEIAEG
jgi:hypothetical protein